MITNVAHLCFTVESLDRTLDFYRDRLGMKAAFEFRNAEGKLTGIYLHVGGRGFLEFFEGKVKEHGKGSYGHVSLEVDEMEVTVAALRSNGIEVSDPKLGGDGAWQAWLTDPDGNRIELHGYKPECRQQRFLDGQTPPPVQS